jgi:Rrf2 family protein
MIFSPTSQYALRALMYLAHHDTDGPVRVQEIATAERIPRQFLSKILHSLRNAGLVSATKGPGGGYRLARPYNRLTVNAVASAVDGDLDLNSQCILSADGCDDENPCALHRPWKRIRKDFARSIGKVTLSNAAGVKPRRKRKSS